MPHRENCIERDVVRLIYSATVPFLLVGLLYAMVASATAYSQGTVVPLVFSVLIIASTCVRLAVSAAFDRALQRRSSVRGWAERYCVAGTPFALLLGLYSAYSFQMAPYDWQLPLVALLFVYPSGMIIRVSVMPRIAIWLLMLAMVPPLVSAVLVGTQAYLGLALIIACYIAGALEMIRFLRRTIVGRMKLEREKEDLSLSDDLTSLPNRRHFRFILDHLHIQASARGNRYAVLLVDLDGFKDVNDGHGHPAGDAVLVEVARRLRECVRESDRVTRLGGDEFAVLLSPPVSDHDVESVASRIIESVSRPIDIEEVTVGVGVSVGAAVSSSDVSPDGLLHAADDALYEAKRAGRGRLVVADAL